MTQILSLSASNSKNSINRILLGHALEKISPQAVTSLDIRDYPMPLYSLDLEENDDFPEAARQVRALFDASDAFIIATPEHNGSMPAVFKNLIDWVSRLGGQNNPMFGPKKPVLLLSASPGPNGGATNLQNLSKLMPWWGADVRGTFSLGKFYENFSDGQLNADQDRDLTEIVQAFVKGL